MNLHSTHHRLIAGALIATFAISALAPAAHAGRGRGHEHKYRRYERAAFPVRVYRAPVRVVEYRRGSGGGSTLAGFLGGIAVGAIITSAAQSHAGTRGACAQPAYCAEPEVRYSFEDPFCRERFASLDLYLSHAQRHCHHALVAQVIDNRDGDCVDVVRFACGRWDSCDRDDRGGWEYDRDE